MGGNGSIAFPQKLHAHAVLRLSLLCGTISKRCHLESRRHHCNTILIRALQPEGAGASLLMADYALIASIQIKPPRRRSDIVFALFFHRGVPFYARPISPSGGRVHGWTSSISLPERVQARIIRLAKLSLPWRDRATVQGGFF